MARSSRSVVASLLLLALAGCGDDGGGDDGSGAGGESAGSAAIEPVDAGVPVDCSGELPAFGEVAIFSVCVGCHGTAVTGDARREAPPSVNFDDYASASANAVRGAQYVFNGVMPPRNSGITVNEADKQQFYRWALCGMPE
jgi:hypothetical protein